MRCAPTVLTAVAMRGVAAISDLEFRSPRVCPRRRQELERDQDSRYEIDESDGHPHQRAGARLIVQRGNIQESRGRKVGRVDDAIAEYEERGQRVARQRR